MSDLSLGPGINPGGQVARVIAACGVELARYNVPTGPHAEALLQAMAVDDAKAVSEHLETCLCSGLVHLVYDGNTGEPLQAHTLSRTGSTRRFRFPNLN